MPESTPYILLAEDEAGHAAAIQRAFRAVGNHAEFEVVGSLRECKASLSVRTPDLLLLDLNFPDGNALALLSTLTEASAFPVLAMTSLGNEQIAVEAMRAGALDYLVKSPEVFAAIPKAVERGLREWHLRREHLSALRRHAESEARYHSVMSALSDGIVSTARDGAITAWNPAAERILGLTGDQLLGMTDFDPDWRAIHEDGSPFSLETHPGRLVLRTGVPQSNVIMGIQKPDGTLTWISINAVPIFDAEDPLPASAVVSFSDITDRKRSEDVLRRISTAVEQSPVSIVITDTKGAIEYVNPKFTAVTGYTSTEVLGQNPRILKSGELSPEAYAELWNAILAGKVWQGEFHNRKKNGELYWEHASISPIRDGRGVITSFVAVKEDITERKAAEQTRMALERQVLHDQRVESIGVLAGGIAHDFNNILTAILGNTEVALYRLGAADPLRKNVESIQAAGRRARDLVQKILLFSRKTELHREPVVVARVIEEALKLLRAVIPSTITLRVELDTAEGMVLMDSGELNQVVMNLCVNAAHSMRESILGVLTVSARRVFKDDRDWIELGVGDTGSGIAPEIRDRIFDPFFTTKPVNEGTGLGLSVVHGILQRAGGTIEVESEVGAGTRFRILLPEVHAPGSSPTVEGETEVLPSLRGHLLLVDDELPIQEMLTQALIAAGCTLVACGDGQEALQTLLAHPGAFDAVISDQTMPRMTGLQLAQQVSQIQPGLAFILMTGLTSDLDSATLEASSISTVILKPALPSDVIRALAPLLINAQK